MCELGHPILGNICHHFAPEYFKNRNGLSQIWKGKQWLRTGRKYVFYWFSHFVCFVFASVFISDGEPGRVCHAPVSMQAIISAPFEVCACVWVCMQVCVCCGTGVCSVDVCKYRRITWENKYSANVQLGINWLRNSVRFTRHWWWTHDRVSCRSRYFPQNRLKKMH